MLEKSTFIETLLEQVKAMLNGEEKHSSHDNTNFSSETETLAKSIADQIMDFLIKIDSSDRSAVEDEEPMSREITADELPQLYQEQIRIAASKLSGTEFGTDQCCEAIIKLRELGFEVRIFKRTTYAFGDKRLAELPDKWFFDQIDNKKISPESAATDELIVICEVKEKPDVIDENMWIQKPYENDPFVEELRTLHDELDRKRLVNGQILPESRAGFTYTQLVNVVLRRFSEKFGLPVICMPQIFASVLANDHPEIGSGRSTEWRSDNIGEHHVVISGRSERGPTRFVYYDWKEDPYHNRGFRVCIILGPKIVK